MCWRWGVEGEGGQRGDRRAGYTGPGGDGKDLGFHPEQDGQHRRFISSNLIYLSLTGIKSQGKKIRKETRHQGQSYCMEMVGRLYILDTARR